MSKTVQIESPEFENAVLSVLRKKKVIVNDIDDPRLERLSDEWIRDVENGKEWGPSSTERMTYAKAEEYCKSLGGRMPTVDELQTILDRSVYDPAVNKQAFKDTKTEYYWTSTKYLGYPNARFVVGFSIGGVNDCYEGNDFCVRPVRVSQ